MALLNKGRVFMESLMGDQSVKSTYKDDSQRSLGRTSSGRKWIKELSSLANVVVGKCARILVLDTEDLQRDFDDEAPASAKQPARYARNLLEYCCFKALAIATVTDHLHDRDFRRFTFDMMLAWDAPGVANKPAVKTDDDSSKSNQGSLEVDGDEDEDEDGDDDDDEDPALFYTDLMPMLAKVDVESTVGLESFARLAPAIPVAADTISVHCQFEALTSSTGNRLAFPVWDKYLGELDKSIKGIKKQVTTNLVTTLKLAPGETVIDIDGTATTQPVLQHIGLSTWPGRLTLTDQALYFEATGVVSYDKAKKYDLSADLRHTVKPVLTGPWGARLFDKAVLYKSPSTPEPVVLEFPELVGRTRREYWLSIIREVIFVHQFIRGNQLESVGRAEALAKAVLGIARLRATKEVFRTLPVRPEKLLTFSLAEEIPGGDLVLKALADRLHAAEIGSNDYMDNYFTRQDGYPISSTSAVHAVDSLAVNSPKRAQKEQPVCVGEVLIGELTPLEKAVVQSRDSHRKVQLAKASVDGLKVDAKGIGTNFAVLQELLLPVVSVLTWFQALLAWEEPSKTLFFCGLVTYIVYRDWLDYCIPLLLLSAVGLIVWLRSGRHHGNVELVVSTPQGQNSVQQLLALQQALAQVEGLLQSANILLLKVRSIGLSAYPQATNTVVAVLLGLALVFALVPFRFIFLVAFWELFTRRLQLREENTERLIRRFREWWYSIPAVPVRFVKPQEDVD